MNWRSTLVVGSLALATSMSGPMLTVSPASAATTSSTVSNARHVCTHTSTGSCIRGGQFCPRAKYNKSGWDAQGRRYVCKGNRTHPHWMRP